MNRKLPVVYPLYVILTGDYSEVHTMMKIKCISPSYNSSTGFDPIRRRKIIQIENKRKAL